MKNYTPTEYASEVYHGKVTDKTVRNWIRLNKLPAGTTAMITPGGHYILNVDEPKSEVDNLVEMMRAKVA